MSTPEILKAERWLTLWNILIISGAALTAIATFFAIRYSDKISFLKDAELSRFQTDAQRDIANANVRAADANARAAEANEHSKSAESHLAGANERASQAYERAAQAEKEAAKFNEIAERERLARLELEARMQPRRLNAAQKAKLASALRPFAALPIGLEWTGGGGQESADLASDVNDAMIGAGITISGRTILADQYFKTVIIRAGKARMAEADAVALFLIQEKLSPKPVTVQPLSNDNEFAISIGSKP